MSGRARSDRAGSVSASERQTLALIRSYRSLAGQFGHGGVIKTTSSPRGALRVLRMRTHTRGLLCQRSYGAEVMAHHAGPNWPVASARRSVSRVLSRRERRGWPSISGRRLPDGSCGRPEGWAARPSRRTGWSPSYLALLRVELAAFHSAIAGKARNGGSSLWRWSSPRGGRVLPATLRWGARTFLTPPGCPDDARPSGRLADQRDST